MINRRRFIAISASATAMATMPFAGAFSMEQSSIYRWSGVALGANASLQFYGKTQKESKVLCDLCLQEIIRLEKIFSLYEPNSSVSKLNQFGKIKNAPKELIELVEYSTYISEKTHGMFDIAIQPLWHAVANGASQQEAESAKELVDYRHIEIENNTIRFLKKNMAVTFNGIAQGYITDKVSALLRANGLENVLVNMGEIKALGNRPDKSPWKLGVKSALNEHKTTQVVELKNMALATSAGSGTLLGKGHHLLNPRTGEASDYVLSLSVVAPDAMAADALSTGLYQMPFNEAQKIVSSLNKFRADDKKIRIFSQV